jgi:hypothetical protein
MAQINKPLVPFSHAQIAARAYKEAHAFVKRIFKMEITSWNEARLPEKWIKPSC